MKVKIKGNILGFAEGAAAVLLTAGSVTFFRACDSLEGKYMACHWAQNTVTLLGTVLILLSLLRILIGDRGVKTGLAIGIFAVGLSAVFVPGTVISLCMMETMRCHTVFRPAVSVLASVLTVLAGTDAAAGLIRTKK